MNRFQLNLFEAVNDKLALLPGTNGSRRRESWRLRGFPFLSRQLAIENPQF